MDTVMRSNLGKKIFLLLLPPLLMAETFHIYGKSGENTSWFKLALTYYHNIICSKECRKYTVKNCSTTMGEPYKLTCLEEIKLIRPKTLVDRWNKEQHNQGYIDFTIKEFGIEHTRAHITSIIPFFISKSFKISSDNGNKALVTGIFKRHTFNVSQYTFKNSNTGKYSSLHATPEHRIYLKNRQAFLPIENIAEKDTLMTSNGSPIKLVDSDRNTGMTDNDKTSVPILVYNMEIQKKHTYFAGSDNILVHNTCQCGICRKILKDPRTVKAHALEERHKNMAVSYLCGINECTTKRGRIDFINVHQLKFHNVYNIHSCRLCGAQHFNHDNLVKHLAFICMPKDGCFETKFKTALHSALCELKTAGIDVQKRSAITTILSRNTDKSRMTLALFLSDSSSCLTDGQFDNEMEKLDKALPDELLHTHGTRGD